MTSEANVRAMTTVRPATAADADAIGRIQVESWRAAYAGLLPAETIAAFDVEARRQMWREGLSRAPTAGSATFVAVDDDEIVGIRDGRRLPVRGRRPASCGRSTSTRRRGARRRARADRSVRASRCATRASRSALLWVLDGNERAERFYRAAGWERDGEKEDVFQGATVTELRYRKQL